ncbi:hypothetical protein V8C26DRAFT_159940 [Trichoderma gracile]
MLSVPPTRGHGGGGGFGTLGGWAQLPRYVCVLRQCARMATGDPVDAFPLQKVFAASLSRSFAAFPVVFVKSTLGNAAKAEAGRGHVLGQEALEAGPKDCFENDTQLGFTGLRTKRSVVRPQPLAWTPARHVRRYAAGLSLALAALRRCLSARP